MGYAAPDLAKAGAAVPDQARAGAAVPDQARQVGLPAVPWER